MNKSWRNIAIALAGVTQAVDIVDQLAKSGYLNTKDFEVCINSLFQQNPESAEAVYGGAANLERGLELLQGLLENQRAKSRGTQVLGYCLGVLHLQQRLHKRPKMLAAIGERLTNARHQLEHFGPTHDNVIANLASIYTENISTLQFRIQVVGEYQYLQQPRVANQVRALLFAAVRAASLWRQVGGSRWQLLLYRRKLTDAVKQLRAEAHHST